jgi:hypothetical protein
MFTPLETEPICSPPETREVIKPGPPVGAIIHCFVDERLRAQYRQTYNPSSAMLSLFSTERDYFAFIDTLVVSQIEKNSSPYIRPTVSWQSSRSVPSMQNGEAKAKLGGWEPYFIGSNLSPDQIAQVIADEAQTYLGKYRQRHYDSNETDIIYTCRKAMAGEYSPHLNIPKAIGFLDSTMYYFVSRFHDRMNAEAHAYRKTTKQKIGRVNKQLLEYQYEDHHTVNPWQKVTIVKLDPTKELVQPSMPQFTYDLKPTDPYYFMTHVLPQIGNAWIRSLWDTFKDPRSIKLPTSAHELDVLLDGHK